MASMDDLIATISGGMQAGQRGNDLKDLHAKLTQTLQPPPAYRPINPYAVSPSAASGPQPPPAPPSSWNESAPASNAHLFSAFGGALGNSPRQGGRGVGAVPLGAAGPGSPVAPPQAGVARPGPGAGHGAPVGNGAGAGPGGIAFVGQRETGFNVPAPRDGASPSPALGSPVRASPRNLGGGAAGSGFGHGQR